MATFISVTRCGVSTFFFRSSQCILLFILLLSLTVKAQTWSSVGNGTNDNLRSIISNSTDLYVVGNFTIAGSVAANRIAKWDGVNWAALGTGMTTGPISNFYVYTLAFYNNDVYAGGNFTTAGGNSISYLAKWNGTNWSSVGSDPNGIVWTMVVHNNELYVAGAFTSIGGISANNIAKWNGSSWVALGGGLTGGAVRITALKIFNGDLYAGGVFTTAGSVSANHIAKWDGANWSAVGTGFTLSGTPGVASLAVYNSELYAGGYITGAGSTTINSIAKWNGTTWSAVGTGMNSIVNALEVFNGELYAGGNFSTADGNPANKIAKWNGSNWTPLGAGMGMYAPYSAMVYTLHVFNNALYVGGQFSTADGVPAASIAKFTVCSTTPNQPSAISGSNLTCSGSSQTYSILPVSGASTYTWSLPTGWTGSSSTTSITATVGNSGTINVTADNSCGSSAPQSFLVTVNPSPAPTINQSGNILNAPAGFVSYQWHLNSNSISGATNQSHTATQSGNYYVVVTNTNNCSGQSNTLNIVVTDVEDASKQNDIIIAPNPVCSTVIVSCNKTIGLISIYDPLGRKVFEKDVAVRKVEIDLSNLPSGLYYLRTEHSQQTIRMFRE